MPLDTDGDGWPDVEERAKGFDPKSATSCPPAPRYAVVDLGPLSLNGTPVALSSTGQRVLTASGRRWSWQSGWEQLELPSDVEAKYDIIRSDGAVIGRMEHFDALEPFGELWFWDTNGVGRSIPGTRRDYTVADLPGEESSWEFYPIKWLRSDDFLTRAIPLTIEMPPIPSDVLVANIAGAPKPVRRLAEASIAADGSGSRWVKPFMSAGDVQGYTHTNPQNRTTRQRPDRIAGYGRASRLRILVATYLAISRMDARNVFAGDGHAKFNVGYFRTAGRHGCRPARRS